MKFFLYTISLFLISCNLDVNTTDPMASKSIKDSKNNNMFIKEAFIDTNDSYCNVDEAWIEYDWQNKLHFFKIVKKKMGGAQLVLKFNPKLYSFIPHDYTTSWELKDSLFGILWSENGQYIINLGEKRIPSNFKISLVKLLPTKKTICKILLRVNNN